MIDRTDRFAGATMAYGHSVTMGIHAVMDSVLNRAGFIVYFDGLRFHDSRIGLSGSPSIICRSGGRSNVLSVSAINACGLGACVKILNATLPAAQAASTCFSLVAR